MKITAINISKLTATLASSVGAVLLLSGVVTTKVVAQDRIAMLSKAPAKSYQTEDADTSLVRSKKLVTNGPGFDFMGSSSALDEILVTDFAAQKKLDINSENVLNSGEVYPKAGWNTFEKYVSALAISPDGKTGSVQLSFTVSNNGTIANVVVKKGLCEAADKKAADLIKNGPAWVNNSSDKLKEVTVTVNFSSQNNEPVFF